MTRESKIAAEIQAMALLSSVGLLPDNTSSDQRIKNIRMRNEYNTRLEQRLAEARKRKELESQNNDGGSTI